MLSELYGVTGAVSFWAKVGSSISFSAIAAAATASSINLFQLPAGAVLEGTVTKHSAAFGGGGITAYAISIGVSGALDKYSSAFDVLQATSGTAFQLSENFIMESMVNPTQVILTANCVGANLNAATSGRVDIWAKFGVLP